MLLLFWSIHVGFQTVGVKESFCSELVTVEVSALALVGLNMSAENAVNSKSRTKAVQSVAVFLFVFSVPRSLAFNGESCVLTNA